MSDTPGRAASVVADPIEIRAERSGDESSIFALNAAAFETDAEARLVNRLRAQARPFVSLVAAIQGEIVGHIGFSPVTLASGALPRLMGLAPMAVASAHQHTGIGSALVRHGLAQCRGFDCVAVCVLGYPAYYARFGFEPASRFGIDSQYDVPDDVFMVLELWPSALEGHSGQLRYHAAFDAL